MKALPLLPTLHYQYMLLSCFTWFLFLYKVRKVFAILKQKVCHNYCLLTPGRSSQQAPLALQRHQHILGWQVEKGSPSSAAHRCFSSDLAQLSWDLSDLGPFRCSQHLGNAHSTPCSLPIASLAQVPTKTSALALLGL